MHKFHPDFKYAEEGVLAYTKGSDVLVVLSNQQQDVVHQRVILTNHPFKEGEELCNILDKGGWDCVKVMEGNRLMISLIHSYPKVYYRRKEEQKPRIFSVRAILQ